jgi:uncharacterized damage-inducible protein DinB
MVIKDIMLPEYDHEMAVTRRVLERIPLADFAWKPHEKSFALGTLATHLANIPRWTATILDNTVFDIADVPEESRRTSPLSSPEEILQRLDTNVAEARRLIDAQLDPQLLAMWTFKHAGQTIFVLPRVAALRRFVFNHNVHHRAQLGVYLRLRNVPVPASYGPSADEG